SKTLAALNWWVSQYPYSVAPLSFTWVYNYGVATGYEPINRPQSDEGLWIADALTALGYTCSSGTYFSTTRTYVNDLRNTNKTDWAYAVFVVDSSNDADGKFSDTIWFAYAYINGPFTVMTYDNDGWGWSAMDQVLAHETGHIFGAADEYTPCSAVARYGYLNIQNTNCGMNPTCIMNNVAWAVCSVTQQQLGWRDTGSDGVPDILDVPTTASLTPYSPDPTNDTTPTYTGSASVGFYPNSNPISPGPNVTLNRSSNVEYRINGGAWQNCTASDGAFDGGTESYTFTTAPLTDGTYTFEVRATDTSTNVTASNPTDTLTIDTHALTVTASASPTTVPSGGATSLTASAFDTLAHGIASWSWDDAGVGGIFSPSASAQNPTYTAPVNTTDSNLLIALTVTATCDGPSPLADSDSATLTVQPVVHVLTVTAGAPSPTTVASGGAATLSANFFDSRTGHSVASWSWDDGGAGGSFSPSAGVQDPIYTAPANTTAGDLLITLTVSATCDGPSPL
ncbi:MAG: hypothetical protein KAX80_05630, partial [Planctomycetes bacterium]|nr:hypothetical protein [Planctomycetota bacterium]